jgi:hypothetical protein
VLGPIMFTIVIATSIWVFVDAKSLGAKKGALGGGFLDSGAGAWCFGCLLVWILLFPCYLATRPKLVAAKATRRQLSASPPAYPAYAQAYPMSNEYGPPQQTWQSMPAPPPVQMPVALPGSHSRDSVTDEIERLHALYQSGALSPEEFDSLKRRLI